MSRNQPQANIFDGEHLSDLMVPLDLENHRHEGSSHARAGAEAAVS